MDLPMFPLGSVLFPGQLLPLHIFEPRYQQMLEHCMSSDKQFGVVLIERGREVGGGDIRSGIGTVATILDATEAAPGHWAIVAAGTRRIRVQRWHPDNPWPAAEVSDLNDDLGTDEDDADVVDRWKALQQQLLLIGGLAAEMGDDSHASMPEVSPDPGLGSFQIAALSPLGDFDRQKVLATTSVRSRLSLLSALLEEIAETMQAAIALGQRTESDDEE